MHPDRIFPPLVPSQPVAPSPMTWPHKLFTGQITEIELRLLRVFLVVADCEGLAAAESELEIGRSTISKHLSDLEIRFGTRLCHRGRSGFSLTDEGKVVYEATKQLLKSIEDFRSHVNLIHTRLTGELYIGLIDTLVTNEGSKIHKAFKTYGEKHPNVSMSIMIGTPGEIERAVRDQQLHVGIVTDRESRTNLAAVTLFEEENYLYGSANHPLHRRNDATLEIEELARHGMVRHGYSEAESEAIARWNLSPKATAHHTEGVLYLILSDRFIGFLPDHYARFWVTSGRIRAILPEVIVKRSCIVAVAHKSSANNPIVNEFFAALR